MCVLVLVRVCVFVFLCVCARALRVCVRAFLFFSFLCGAPSAHTLVRVLVQLAQHVFSGMLFQLLLFMLEFMSVLVSLAIATTNTLM